VTAGWHRRGASFIALAAFAILAAGSMDSGGGGTSSNSPATDRRIDAFVMSHDFVKDRLKAPSTAEFPWYDEKFVEDLGNGKFRVTAYVDAENSFGAMLRSNYVCALQYLGNDKWHCTRCVILER